MQHRTSSVVLQYIVNNPTSSIRTGAYANVGYCFIVIFHGWLPLLLLLYTFSLLTGESKPYSILSIFRLQGFVYIVFTIIYVSTRI